MQSNNDKSRVRHVGKHTQINPEMRAELEDQTQDATEQPLANFQPQRRSSKKSIKKTIIWALVGCLAICGVLIGKFVYDINNPQALFSQLTATPELQTPTPVATATPQASQAPTPTPTLDPEAVLLSQADLEFMKNRVNILVLGLDESVERANWGSFRSDTMILISVNFETKVVNMISVPRDSYVKIINADKKFTTEYGKVNSAFPAGGGAQKKGYLYAMNTVSYILGGIPIDYYVGFNMNVVKEVVNAMGGVNYDVDIEVKMNGRELHPGYQFMDGQAVLDYCRQRKGSSDIARVDRQQRMLMAIFRQLKSTGQIANVPQIYQAVEQNIQTNLSFTQISALALLALQMDENELYRNTLDGEFLNVNNTSYWGLHMSKIEDMVNEVFGIKVNVDGDMSAGAIRKRIEEALALISPELSAAKAAINDAQYILSDFGDWINESGASQLREAISQVEAAVDAGDKTLLDTYTPKLVSLNNSIFDQLRGHGALPEKTPEIPEIPEETPVG